MRIENPIIRGTNPDPSVCRVGGDYYLVTSTFEYFPGVPVYHSTDLVNWRQVGHALTRRSQLDFDARRAEMLEWYERMNVPSAFGIYAPVIRHHNGLFYMITTHVGGRGNFYVTASDPAGPWSDPVWLDPHVFDPSLFFDDDGKVYYTRRGERGVVQAELDLAAGRLVGEPRRIVEKFICNDIEGPHLYKIRGRYFLMAAEGGSRFGHCEVIGRSESPWGPFEPCPHNPVLSMRHLGHTAIRDTGHAELVEDAAGNWWVFCLGTRHRHYNSASILGRETFLAPLEWSADGWPVVNQDGTVPEHFETSRLPAQAARATWRDDFDQGALDLAWKHIRNPVEQLYSLNDRPGWLRLAGSPDNLDGTGAPTFIGRRQEDFEMTFACRLDFEPGDDHEEAGLAVYTNNNHHYQLAVTRRGGRRVALLRRRAGDLVAEGQELPLAPGNLRLSVVCDGNRYAFSIATEGQAEQAAGSGLARLLAPEVADNVSVWTGVHLGLYASGNGRAGATPAYVDWAEYRHS